MNFVIIWSSGSIKSLKGFKHAHIFRNAEEYAMLGNDPLTQRINKTIITRVVPIESRSRV